MAGSGAVRVALDFLGCRLNIAEVEAWAERLRREGYVIVSPEEAADVYILNTCTVTATADAKCRHRLRRARRRSPKGIIIAVGCYARSSPETLKAVGADLVLSNSDDLVAAVRASLPPRTASGGFHSFGRTRSFIKIQEGCNTPCSYCIVPQVRGPERSRSPEEIIAEIRERTAQGYQEVVLTGTNIGRYRWDGLDLRGLLRRILAETEVARIRVSSLQPQEISEELLSLWRDRRLCPHFHLPLQSGSDRILHLMRRRYSVSRFREAVLQIRALVPDAVITTDILAGFPGEEESDFMATLDLCRELGLARVHAFAYSPRPGTPAAACPQLPAPVKRERLERLLRLSHELHIKARERVVGQDRLVLWEKEVSAGVWTGLTEDYFRVYLESRELLANRFTLVRIRGLSGEGLWGEVVRHVSAGNMAGPSG